MLANKRRIVMGVVVAVFLGLGLGLLAWPNYARSNELNVEIKTVTEQIKRSAQQERELDALRQEHQDAQRLIAEDFKHVGLTADIDEMIPRLSLPVDQVTVLDQTFSAAREATPVSGERESEGFYAKPLDIEMRAVFDSVFAVLCAVESLEELARITSVHMMVGERTSQSGSPVLTASIGVEAIYAPVSEEDE